MGIFLRPFRAFPRGPLPVFGKSGLFGRGRRILISVPQSCKLSGAGSAKAFHGSDKVVMNIADPSKDNVVLLPKTVDYYQMELTRMLETERYGQAMELLRFLLRCQTDDERSRDEWGSLLDWLSTMFPDHADGTRPDAGEWEEEETENDLRRNHVLQKAAADRAYADKLLEALRQPVSPEKQFMALEQLVYVDHPVNQASGPDRPSPVCPVQDFTDLEAPGGHRLSDFFAQRRTVES